MQWLKAVLLLLCFGWAHAHNTEKPSHGVSIQFDVVTVNSDTSCVFVTLLSETPVVLTSAQWLHGNWINDTGIDCSHYQDEFDFTAQIPSASAESAVQVLVTWQLEGDEFSAIQRWPAETSMQSRSLLRRASEPADPNTLFIICIGE